MADVFRSPLRMDCKGIFLNAPIDKIPPGYFPYLFNVRVIQDGWIEGRPGYGESIQLADVPNSIRRLNDPTEVYAPTGYIYVGGGGTKLYAGIESAYTSIDTGYSGNPLSLIPFRPNNSPESWMYVYDANKLSKVRPDGVLRAVGVVPPNRAPSIEYAAPASVSLNDGQSLTNWSTSSPTVVLYDRTLGSIPTIGNILYDSGSTGWCCISPSMVTPSTTWMGSRMKVILSGSTETVLVRDVLLAIATTTVASILYDAGTTGACSLTLTGNPSGLARNSLIQIASEVVRVLEVIPAPTGTAYSVRCVTGTNHVVGATVTGLISWYTYTVNSHSTGETISSSYLDMVVAGAGTFTATYTGPINASQANGRPIDPANDYLHISFLLVPASGSVATSIQLLATLDATPNFSFTTPGDSWIWDIPLTQFTQLTAGSSVWVEIVIPISSGVQYGNQVLNFSNITGLAVQITTTGAGTMELGFDWWYFFGTYGPDVTPNAPTGLIYYQANRDSTTGAHSVPGPGNRQALFPLREGVIITPVISSQAGVDSNDFYRLGAAVTSPLYVGTTPNSGTLTDNLPDSSVLATDQAPDLTAIQPWPILQAPWSGTCNVSGTTVQITGTSPINTALLNATAILINGQVYLTYGQPRSTTFIELTQDAGQGTGIAFQIASPTLMGQPLPYAFGALEGPFAPVIFGLGDPINGGLLYFTNYSDADSASDANTLELTNPSNNLVSGAIWKGIAFAGNRDEIFTVQYSYLSTIGATTSNQFQWRKTNAPSGMWSRWSVCACPLGVAFLGRDGIYITTDNQCVSITDETLYPLFPHDGQAAAPVFFGEQSIYPVNMQQTQYLRLSYCDGELRFTYLDTVNNWNTLIFEIYKKRWFLNNYENDINFHYLVENSEAAPNQMEILQMALDTKSFMLAGGNTDGAAAINSLVLTPSDDNKDERAQKLYVDAMTQAGGTGTLNVTPFYDFAQNNGPTLALACNGQVQQFQENIAKLGALGLHLNIAAKFYWTGGPAGPRVAAWEPSGFMQPYLSQSFVTQINPLSFPGWKHLRRAYPALISTSAVQFTIQTQDGRTYGPFTIASTNGVYRQLPQMLPQAIKDLAFGIQLVTATAGQPFAFFPSDFVIEVKEWTEESYIKLAVFRA